nr:retrotransposon Gag domain, retroviral aspartyl protease [Tanacetum cinerariifolium]
MEWCWKMEWWGAVYKPNFKSNSTLLELGHFISSHSIKLSAKQRSGGGGNRYEEVELSYSNHNRRPFHKIEFPVFSGGDPRGWILKAEKYFRFYNTLDEEKVDVAAMHLEGDALDLYSWMSAEHDISY